MKVLKDISKKNQAMENNYNTQLKELEQKLKINLET